MTRDQGSWPKKNQQTIPIVVLSVRRIRIFLFVTNCDEGIRLIDLFMSQITLYLPDAFVGCLMSLFFPNATNGKQKQEKEGLKKEM